MHPLSIHHSRGSFGIVDFRARSDLSTAGRLSSDSEPLTPLLDLHPLRSSHMCLRSNSWDKSLRPTILLVALLPYLNPDWYSHITGKR